MVLAKGSLATLFWL